MSGAPDEAGPMKKRFTFAREDRPGPAWLDRFVAGRSEAERWYLGAGRGAPPSARECRAALRRYMPELLPAYDQACDLVGDDDLAHRILSHYRPPPIVEGCSQAVWLGDEGPALVRNYDFRLDILTGRVESTSWHGSEVIASAQRPWGGCLDGMNRDGLVASLTAGGGPSVGIGFAVILVLRYVLETCTGVGEAVEALKRIPVALSQNVTVLDQSGAYATVFLGPDRVPVVSHLRACTNHQETRPAVSSPASIDSLERQKHLLALLEDRSMTLSRLAERFHEPPLYSRRWQSATGYTAVYRPAEREVDFLWPGTCRTQRIGAFAPGAYVHDFGELIGED